MTHLLHRSDAWRNRIPAWMAAVLITAVLLTVAGTASADSGPWLDEDFEGGTNGVFDSGWGVHSTSDGHVGNGLISRIPRGDHWGTSAWWQTDRHIGEEPEEMWMRYYVKFPEGFRVDSPSRGKLPGPAGLYSNNCRGGRASTPSAPCWSARMMFSRVYVNDGTPSWPYDPDRVTRIGYYPYLLDANGNGRDGQVMPWDADVATLRHGRWYCVETRVQMNTPGQADGILEGYVDGQPAFEKTDAVFRRSSEAHIGVESIWFDVYYGGQATSPADNAIHFDSLAAGPTKIGCNDNPDTQGSFFDDESSVFEGDIERLAASGITRGCNPPDNTRFCPDDYVTRGQMAAFLNRALGDRLDASIGDEPEPPPPLWGIRTGGDYADTLEKLAQAGAPADVYKLTHPVDDGGSHDWTRSGSDSPGHWVPIQLGRIHQAGATPYISVTVDDPAGLASGNLDTQLAGMMDAYRRYLDDNPGATLMLAPLPEANRRERSYHDRPDRYIEGFRHLVTRARKALGADRVRIVYSQHHTMVSDRWEADDHPAGAHDLWWPGHGYVDAAEIRDLVGDSNTDPGQHFRASLETMAATAGPGTPIYVTTASPNPGQGSYLSQAAGWAAGHPQVTGVIWDDVVTNGTDYRITAPSPIDGVAQHTADVRHEGDAWLFSPEADDWSDDRAATAHFADSRRHLFTDDIRWLAATGVTRGCNPPDNTRFCPDDYVTRGQMAAFLVRALELGKGDETFRDTAGHTFEADIASLASVGITRGCNPPEGTRFCPDDYVTRGQMAAFLVRAGLTG